MVVGEKFVSMKPTKRLALLGPILVILFTVTFGGDLMHFDLRAS